VPGRLHLATPPTLLGERYGIITMDPSLRLWTPRYAIAPGQETLILRGIEGVRTAAPVPRGMVGKPLAGLPCEITTARWGLVSSWASSPDVGVSVIDSAAETLERRPVLWELFSRRRCVVPVDGYYEWRDAAKREPHWIGVMDASTRSTAPFLLAAVWDRWEADPKPRDGTAPASGPSTVDTFAILTIPASGPVTAVHPRRPMILPVERLAEWLAPPRDDEKNNAERLRSACVNAPIPEMTWYAVSQLVNSPRHDDPRCLEPAARLALPGFGD